jgi:hypothetical protein
MRQPKKQDLPNYRISSSVLKKSGENGCWRRSPEWWPIAKKPIFLDVFDFLCLVWDQEVAGSNPVAPNA